MGTIKKSLLNKEGDKMREKYVTNSPRKKELTIQTDSSYPNLKNIDGDSVDEHKNMEVANALLAHKEIAQQQENL
ncbi:hypothetical protein A9C19_08485 [Bacillus weihaiensis]|uniref:Uncharacterized protein n=2 Tax=Bacillus weihaiensis TaxID=1547283 RepID=A0A1L3MR08_9BACI|nr:hypothetical protein A9C19_08485 [Bacillus weihaiensis]